MEKSNHTNIINIIFRNLQFIFTIATIVLLVWYFFDSSVLIFLQISLGICLVVMSVNNYILYKKIFNTILYSLIGITLLILSILVMLGV